jgi:lipopolysaccharide heptosyltransferase II
MNMADTTHRTLIIRFSSIGDILLSSLLVRVLRTRFPGSVIDYVVKSEYADLVRHNPHLTGVIPFPMNGGLRELREMRNAIRSNRYDLIVDIHESLRSRFLCWGFPGVVRIHKRKLARFLLVNAHWDVYEWFGGAPSVAERYLEPVQRLGIANDGAGLEVFFPPTAATIAEKYLLDAGVSPRSAIIGICPSARHNNKMWIKERFAETASSLAREHQATVVLFGSGSHEKTHCQEVKSLIERQAPDVLVMNLAGQCSLLETAAMMDYCSVVVTNDTGLMHLAAARKRKVVAIFGPTAREFGFFPYGTTSTVVENTSLSCRPCTHIGLPECPQRHFKCMKDIQAAQVIAAARMLLKGSLDA